MKKRKILCRHGQAIEIVLMRNAIALIAGEACAVLLPEWLLFLLAEAAECGSVGSGHHGDRCPSGLLPFKIAINGSGWAAPVPMPAFNDCLPGSNFIGLKPPIHDHRGREFLIHLAI